MRMQRDKMHSVGESLGTHEGSNMMDIIKIEQILSECNGERDGEQKKLHRKCRAILVCLFNLPSRRQSRG